MFIDLRRLRTYLTISLNLVFELQATNLGNKNLECFWGRAGILIICCYLSFQVHPFNYKQRMIAGFDLVLGGPIGVMRRANFDSKQLTAKCTDRSMSG